VEEAVISDRTISLVLGSGGARGLAHIGAIRCLEDNGYEIAYISGSSIGALIGGIYAAGELETYASWVSELSRSDVIRLLDWKFSRGAVFSSKGILTLLENMIADRDIESLDIGFTAVATDINEQQEVWLNRGSLFEAIRASIAMPLIFEPVEHGHRTLVDGGLINPVPIAPTLNADTSRTIAIRLDGIAAEPEVDRKKKGEGRTPDSDDIREKIARFIDDLMPQGSRDEPESLNAIELALQSIDTMQRTIADMKLAVYGPDLEIQMPGNLCSFLDFHRGRELIEIGYRRTEAALSNAEGWLV
jgi:NTE family protein